MVKVNYVLAASECKFNTEFFKPEQILEDCFD